uniref:EGF-like domain-containing protein n=1 Tax=Globodera pallida TaxID=36090 RepID=A0A183CSG8_GLOPA
LHGLKCKRARKAEWANGTESLDSLCPYQKGIEERCYVLNCSDGNNHRIDWGCVADFGDAHFQCSASCFNANGFACKCRLGAAGVDMANENMNIVVPPALSYDDDDNEYNYNYDNDDFYNYDAFDYDFHCDHDDFHYDYADIGYSFNVYGHGVANH